MVEIRGGDYATARPSPEAMKAAGWKFVCRYLRDLVKANGDKSLSWSEAASLWLAGIDIVSNEETTGEQGLRGMDGGMRDAVQALLAHTDRGGPSGRPIYFSPWDHDPALLTASQWATMANYLRGCVSVLGLRRVGLYGGRRMLTWAFDNHLITYGWQAAGWAHGGIEPRAHIIQHVSAPWQLPGTDANTAVKADFGQWHYSPTGDDMTDAQAQDLSDARKGIDQLHTDMRTLINGDSTHTGLAQLGQKLDQLITLLTPAP
jgi:hypothetical protein